MPTFVQNVEELRERASRKIEEGAVTETYKGDVKHTIDILNEALATEIVCVLRYLHHYFMATGVHGKAVANEFKEHADAEREHADEIAERIQQLGGKPNFNPRTLVDRSVSQYIEGETLADMIREDLIAERIVIEVYQKMVRHFGDDDPTTRVLIEHILAEEEEHASDLSDLLYVVDPRSGETEGEDPGTRPLQLGHREQSAQDQQSQSPRGRASARAQSEEVEDALQKSDKQGREGRNVGAGSADLEDLSQRNVRSPDPPAEEFERNQPEHARGEMRPKRAATQGQGSEQFAGRGSVVEPAHAPGTTGRRMNRRGNTEEIQPESAARSNAGAQTGTNRTPKIVEKRRKNKVA